MIESNQPANFETPPIGASDQTDKQGSTAEKTKAVVEKNHITPNRQEAAKIIEKAWKGHQAIVKIRRDSIKPTEPKKSQWHDYQKWEGMIEGPVYKGPHGPKHEISVETIQKVVGNLVEAKDKNLAREGLRRLANILFTGPGVPYSTMMKLIVTDFPAIQGLVYLLFDPESDLKDIEKVMIESVKDWRSGFDAAAWAESETEAKSRQEDELNPNIDTFAEARGIDPETWVEITHGGGEWNIEEFLRGETEGYPLQRGGVGLQVSPKDEVTHGRSRDDYAPKAAAFFDRAAVFTAKIQAKYLKATVRGYEAGLPSSSVAHLKDKVITPLNKGQLCSQSLETWQQICQARFGDPELGTRIYNSQQNCRKSGLLR
jgi:hypothetical protein